MKTYRLPCICSATIEIGAGQAGGSVACPACGRVMPVPKLRQLTALEAVESGQSGPHGGWSAPHASMLAGAAVAVAAWSAAAFFGAPLRPMLGPDAIRAAVAAADDSQIREAWQSFARSGVDRPPTPEERRLLQSARFRQGVSRGLLVIGAVGALAALVGAAAVATQRKGTP